MSSTSSTNLMNKWRLDFTTGGSRIASRQIEQGLNPPGYVANFSTASSEIESAQKSDQQQQHLLSKRAWDMALQPIKSLPMNMFMMYMAGNTISIFPIMMVAMMVWRPIQAVMSVGTVFKPIEVSLFCMLEIFGVEVVMPYWEVLTIHRPIGIRYSKTNWNFKVSYFCRSF